MRHDECVYLAEKIRASLASDPGVSELGIEVAVVAERVVLRGTLTSERRKDQVLALVGRLRPDLEIDDELRVETMREPKAETV